ncbi:DEAD/DEAH box helicase family protein [Marimonas arenosa]|uniref:DEAD/DEAH box helicase family protein n=1 Tax=Marimonas arenosa TaxID=1795305 RepID=A0AAE3WDT4_9RHOB|nr:DEAD/DEAH box helicase family protein [Marimonas arenosa]MDQ2091151.1 DEAD/DEAH box helicase family protein [Marimonas arenosa]
MADQRILRQITQRLSLRRPQEEALEILASVLDNMDFEQDLDVDRLLGVIKDSYPSVEAFEREFPTLCFALATGVGKTRLMGAFITYMYLTGSSKNFFVLAPNTTIYQKLVEDFSRQTSPKYVFRGISQFAQTPPIIVTGDTWEEGRGIRGSDLFGGDVVINIFNVDKINKDKGRIRSFRETLGESYFDYLAALPDLVMLMDEAHRYRAKAATKAIFDLKPKLGLELTATPKTVGASPKPFKNVIYDYGLGNAMRDGYVKQPAVATRTNFNPKDHTPEQIEDIMLKDGVFYHEYVRTELELYSKQSGKPRVYPFMLVVAQDTTHASELRKRIESEDFYNGAYKGRVAEVHSKLTGEESDEAMQKLVELETSPDTEIVIHVNKLKEGWDVTNLYTIVPLRASASDILTEQTLGRGLRLPYGKRTGVEVVDTLTVIAHDRFDAVIQKAQEADSIVKVKEIHIGGGGDIPEEKRKVISVAPTYQTALAGPEPGQNLDEAPAEFIYEKPQEREIARRAIELVEHHYAPRIKNSAKELQSTEVIEAIVKDIQSATSDGQGTLDIDTDAPDIKAIVERTAKAIVENTIEIPEIVVIPDRQVHFWFEDFDLSRLDQITFQPVDDDILVRDLGSEARRIIERGEAGAQEERLENYIVRHLIALPEIDYDSQAELLYKLSSQVIGRLSSYLPDERAVENVALAHGERLATFVFEQMKDHLKQTQTAFQVQKRRAFTPLRPQQFAVAEEKILPLSQAAMPLSATKSYVFRGGAKTPYPMHKFDSDPERRFACLVDDEGGVVRWMKPGPNQFQIEYAPGKPYQPDFVVETGDRFLIVEVKADNELDDTEVQQKAAAARQWTEHANALSEEAGGKQWSYHLLPASRITPSATLAGLSALSH